VKHLLTYIDTTKLRSLKVVVNPGNGGAGSVVDLLQESLPFEFIKINHDPDGSFPAGVPNPMLSEIGRSRARPSSQKGPIWE
jgi:phosphomannomutase